MIQTISSLLDIKQKGINLISKLKNNVYQIKNKYSNYIKLKVYFEEFFLHPIIIFLNKTFKTPNFY